MIKDFQPYQHHLKHKVLKLIKKVIQGLFGLTQYQLRIGIADEKIVKNRMITCKDCDERIVISYQNQKKQTDATLFLTLGKCRSCGCNLTKKISLQNQKCPLKKWV